MIEESVRRAHYRDGKQTIIARAYLFTSATHLLAIQSEPTDARESWVRARLLSSCQWTAGPDSTRMRDSPRPQQCAVSRGLDERSSRSRTERLSLVAGRPKPQGSDAMK